MAAREETRGTRFTVDLGGVELPTITAKRVESEIRTRALGALADIDPGGARVVDPRMRDPWDGTLGDGVRSAADHPAGRLRLGRPHTFEGCTPLRRRPHPGDVGRDEARAPDPQGHRVRAGLRRAHGRAGAKAALDVEGIDAHTKAQLRKIAQLLPKLEKAKASLPESAREAVAKVESRMSEGGLASRSRRLALSAEIDDCSVAEAMEVAERILEDGAGSIYAPDGSLWKVFSRPIDAATQRDERDDLKDADHFGGVAGAAGGTALGGATTGTVVGAAAGAVAGGAVGAAASSAGFALAWVIDSIF